MRVDLQVDAPSVFVKFKISEDKQTEKDIFPPLKQSIQTFIQLWRLIFYKNAKKETDQRTDLLEIVIVFFGVHCDF